MANRAQEKLQQLINDAVNKASRQKGDLQYLVKRNDSEHWFPVVNISMEDPHVYHITSVDDDGIAVRGVFYAGLDGKCDCSAEIRLKELAKEPDAMQGNLALHDLIDTLVTESVARAKEGIHEFMLKRAVTLREMIKEAELDGYETDTLYEIVNEEGAIAPYFFCTRVGKCPDTGLQELGGFRLDESGIEPTSILSIYIGKKVDIE